MNLFRIFFLALLSLLLGQYGKGVLFAQSYNFKNYSAEQGFRTLIVDAICQDSKGYLWIGGYGGLSEFNGKTVINNYSPKDGLANRLITSVVQDKAGNIWAGTPGGLNKFDGKKFFTFTKKDGLSGDRINSLATDRYGNLWIATTQGITLYNGKVFTSLALKKGLKADNFSLVYVDQRGNIWMSSSTEVSEIIFNPGSPQDQSLADYKVVNGIYNSPVTSITEDGRGNTWFGLKKGGVLRYNGLNSKLFTTQEGLSDNDVLAVVKDARSCAIWVGTSNGLNKISENGKIENFKVRGVLNGNEIRKLLVDVEGNLWLGTKNGLYRFRDLSFCTFSERDGLQDPSINFVFRDNKKNLWVGTPKEGVYRYNCPVGPLRTGSNVLKNFSQKDGLIGTRIYAGIKDKEGNIWIGTNKGVSVYNGKAFKNYYGKKDGLKSDSVFSILQDSRGRIWLGSLNGGTILDGNKTETFALESEEQNFLVLYEFEDSKRNIWLATYSGGLFRYDGKSYENFSKKLNLESKAYFAIVEGEEGILYFGSFEGVYIYDPSGKKLPAGRQLSLISEKDGLSSDLVYTLSLDAPNENLYIGTSQGLNKLDVKEFKNSGKIKLKQYGLEEGLSALDFNPRAMWRDNDSTFWMGTSNGLIHFNPALFYENRIESRTSIKAYSLSEDTLLPPNSEFPSDQNNIAFEYIGICLTNPDKVRYKYTLEGFDTTWSETKETFTRYLRLSHGEYTFKVLSCNNEGVWNRDPATFSFSIQRPLSHQWQFWSLIALSAVILVGIFFRLRLKAIKIKQAEELSREIHLANNELKALRAQMDPHFIFNSLSSIQSFIMMKDEESALHYLNKFAKLMRMILSNSEKPSVTVQEEINALNLYLELEALRWDNKFDFSIIINTNIETDFQEIPSMLIQPFVENAIIHGVVPKEKGKGKIEVVISKTGPYIVCTIKDNGIGRKKSLERREKSNHALYESMGMKITSERLEVLNRVHRSDLSVQISDLKDEQENVIGTKVEIFIPVT